MVAYFDPNEEGGTETVALLPPGEAGSEPSQLGCSPQLASGAEGGA